MTWSRSPSVRLCFSTLAMECITVVWCLPPKHLRSPVKTRRSSAWPDTWRSDAVLSRPAGCSFGEVLPRIGRRVQRRLAGSLQSCSRVLVYRLHSSERMIHACLMWRRGCRRFPVLMATDQHRTAASLLTVRLSPWTVCLYRPVRISSPDPTDNTCYHTHESGGAQTDIETE